jgi:hypothetical protein
VPLGVNMVMFWAKGLKLVEKAITMERCCCRANGQSSQSRGFGETGMLTQRELKVEGAGKRLRGT